MEDIRANEERNRDKHAGRLEDLDREREQATREKQQLRQKLASSGQEKEQITTEIGTVKEKLAEIKTKLRNRSTEMLRNECQKIQFWVNRLNSWQLKKIDLDIDFDKIREMNLGTNFVKKIRGKVYNFFKVKDSRFEKAVNTMIRSNIYKTVVEDANTAEMILKYNLTRGVKVLLPLNKLRVQGFTSLARKLKDDFHEKTPDLIVISKARSLVQAIQGAQVFLPFELIEYSPTDQKLISFVFSNYLVVSNMDVGRVICDHLGVRCVTLDGERVEKGILVGGYQEREVNLLQMCHEFYQKKQKLTKFRKELKANVELEKMETGLETRERELNKKFQEKEEQREQIEDKMEQLMRREQNESKELKQKEIQQIEERIAQVNQNIEKRRGELEILETEDGSEGSDLRTEIEKEKKHMSKIQNQISDLEHKELMLRDIIKTHNEEIARVGEELIELRAKFSEEKQVLKAKELEKEVNDKELGSLRAEFKMVIEQNSKLERQKKELDDRIKQAENNKKRLIEEQEKLESETKQVREDIRKCQASLENLAQEMNTSKAEEIMGNSLEELNKELKHLVSIGKHDTMETVTVKMRTIQARIKQLESRESALKRSVNMESEDLYLKLEKDFRMIGTNKKIVQVDRNVITSNIVNLDQKKYFRVRKCFEQVNQNLMEMFTSLVPGAKAKMILKNYPPTERNYQNTQNSQIQGGLFHSTWFSNWKTRISRTVNNTRGKKPGRESKS